jgi:hypothetical protein
MAIGPRRKGKRVDSEKRTADVSRVAGEGKTEKVTFESTPEGQDGAM